MHRYISLSDSYWKTLNSLWAVLKESEFRPEEVVLITEKKSIKKAEEIAEDMKVLMNSYDLPQEVRVEKMGDSDYDRVSKTVAQLIDENLKNDDENALDITGGKKMMVAATLFTQDPGKLDHIFFLDFEEDEDLEMPYPNIPVESIELKDLVEEKKRAI